MKIKIIIILSLTTILYSSCYSYKVFPKEFREIENKEIQRKAYIINDTLDEELEILKSSKLFIIIGDSINADLKIKLYPLKEIRSVSRGFLLYLLTLSQVPSYDYHFHNFKFDEIEQNTITEKEFELSIATRAWFWDIFAMFNDNGWQEEMGKSLLGMYRTME